MKTKAVQLTALLASAAFAVSSASGQIIFVETFGTVSGTTEIEDHSFDNEPTLSFSGTGDIRSTTESTGYVGASGEANVFLTGGSERSLIISGIDTSSFDPSSFVLSFGAHKNINASDMSELVVSFSTDGDSWTDLSFPAQPTGSGTSNWRLVTISDASMIPASETLSLRWVNTATPPSGTNPQFRIDDITLIPEPSTYAALFGVLAMGLGVFLRRRRR